MKESFVSIVGSIATVALIVIATRWLSSAKGAEFPKTRDSTHIYEIKWQWRAVGFVGGLFGIVICVWSWYDLHSPDGFLIAIAVIFVIAGLWLASGSIITDEAGVTKTVFFHSRSLAWKGIDEVRVHKKHGGAVELRSASRSLVIDSRLNAFQYFLKEVEERTGLSGKVPD